MSDFFEFLKNYNLFGKPAFMYIVAVIIFVFVSTLMLVIKHLIKKLKNKNIVFDALYSWFEGLSMFFYVFISIYLPFKYLGISSLDKFLNALFVIVVTYEISKIIIKIVSIYIKNVVEKKIEKDENTTNIIITTVKLFVWILAFIFVLSNLGLQITPLVTSLGIISITVGFAMQKILADIFSSLSIYIDKPFSVGDFISIGNDSGIVKKIGIRSTKIQTLDGHQLIVANTDISTARINNFGKIEKKQLSIKIGVKKPVYEKQIKEIIETKPKASFKYLNFLEYSNSTYNYEIFYNIQSNDFENIKAIHKEICFEIIEKFADLDISYVK